MGEEDGGTGCNFQENCHVSRQTMAGSRNKEDHSSEYYKQFVEFDATMKELGKNASVHIYEGSKHAFANASGTVYEPVAAEDSWQKTVNFLKAYLD